MDCKAKGITPCSNPINRILLGYCHKHYRQYKRHGAVYRTSRDERQIIIKGDTALIPIGVNAKDGYAQIDLSDVEKCWGNWALITGGYVMRTSDKTRLHHIVVAKEQGKFVDHINGDTKDNRRSNLRSCRPADNARNCAQTDSDNYTNPFKGVYYVESAKKYQAALTFNYKKINLGRFWSPEEAAHAYNKGAIKYFGEFARLNNV